MDKPSTILKEINNFYGTEHYYKWNAIFNSHLLTDGTMYIAESCGAHWLMDTIASYANQRWYKENSFIVADLVVGDEGATLSFGDGNGHTLQKQKIEYTDFPLSKITIWICKNGDKSILMLPSEY